MKQQFTSPSYMEMRIDRDQGDPIFLRIPTFWYAVKNQWIGAIKTPKTKKLITASGKDSFELQNNFNIEMSKLFHSECCEEILSMFKPMCYWKEIE